jgi:hypothetical protein
MKATWISKWKGISAAAGLLLLFVTAVLVVIAVLETNPPTVISQSANPAIIPGDGSGYTELTIHALDDSAIDTVTVDLTPIGGKVVHLYCKANYTEGENIVNIFNYTTNATCSLGTYNLAVNVTDATTNRNYNTGNILLVVGPSVHIEDGQIAGIGATTVINITLDTAPDGLSGYNMTLALSNTSIAEIISVEFPVWATLNAKGTLPADTVWLKAVDITNSVTPGATNVTLAELTIRGDAEGSCNITAVVTKMDPDGGGDPINTSVNTGRLTVLSVVPLPGYDNPPTDPDGDGLYEDLNGNGRKDFDDVVQLFKYLEWIEANEPIACFDFNGNGRIDFDDIVQLFKEV